MNTLDFFFKRLLKAAFVVLGVVVFNFLLIHLAPGDPATVIAGESGAGDSGTEPGGERAVSGAGQAPESPVGRDS